MNLQDWVQGAKLLKISEYGTWIGWLLVEDVAKGKVINCVNQ